MAAKEFQVAIELGSSKITGIAGKKSMDGSIQVLAVVREDATSCIRKGVVYNIDKTSACLTNIIKKLKTLLKSEISQVYVGVGGQSIRSIRNVIVKNLPEDTIISQDMINELMDNNRSMSYPDLEILDAATQEYKVGTQYQIEPVGIQCTKLEGNFLNILYRKSFYRNLNKCFENANISIAEMYLAPIALAHSVLTEAEKRSGCMLVDLGADTTTVSVYYKNILRQLAVIPLGGNNITKDITSLQIDDNEAEELKIKYASAVAENNDADQNSTIQIDKDRTIDRQSFIDIVEARVSEIVQNAWCQVPSEYNDKLLGGIILTGGGSNMKDIKKAFTAATNITKVRIANTVTFNVTSTDNEVNAKNGTMNTILGLLAKGDMNCAGQTLIKTDLFGGGPETPEQPIAPEPIRRRTEDGRGRVISPQELEEIERKRRIAETKLEPQTKPESEVDTGSKKKGGFFSRTMEKIKEFGTKIISEETDDEGRR